MELVETFDEHVLKPTKFLHACKLQAVIKTHHHLMMTSGSDCSCW